MSKKGNGQFVLPSVMMITALIAPAKFKRKGVNPFTKEEVRRRKTLSQPAS